MPNNPVQFRHRIVASAGSFVASAFLASAALGEQPALDGAAGAPNAIATVPAPAPAATANPSPDPDAAQTFYLDGIAAYKKGDLVAASAAMARAIAADPVNANAQEWSGYLLLRGNDPVGAIPFLERALALHATPDAYTNLGNALMRKPARGQTDTLRALDLFRKAATASPDSAEAQFNLGVACGRVGLWSEAAGAYRKTISLDPKDGRAYANLGDILIRAGEDPQAIDALKQATVLAPDDAAAWRDLATLQLAAGDTGGAVASMEGARQADGQDYATLVQLGRAYASLHRDADAVEAYSAAADLQATGAPSAPRVADPALRFDQGVLLARSGKTDDALTAYNQALAVDPHYFDALLNSGALLFQAGRTAEAVLRFAAATSVKPTSMAAWMNLATARTKAGDVPGAVAAWQRCAGLDSTDYASRENLAALLMSADQPMAAVTIYRQMAALRPEAAGPEVGLGLAYEKMRNFDAAYAALKRALVLNPKSAAGYNDLGVLFERRGELPEAMAAYRKALALDPTLSDARANLARYAAAGVTAGP